MYFDGSVCGSGQGIDTVFISPNGTCFEASNRLSHFCTNNQAEYKALLFSLEILESMTVKHVEAYGDSLLIVQQVCGAFQCLDGSLNLILIKI